MELISTPKEIDLIPTSSFEFGDYPFKTFNYLQSLCYSHCFQNNNLVISAATSAGKTIVAELAISHTISKGKKAIFLSPLKAVTSEKHDDWTDKKHYLSKKKVEIITGDHRLTETRVKKVNEADLVLMTSEMLDTRTRYSKSAGSAWLKDVGVLVVDEAHLLTTNRGPALEVGLMRFSELNPKAKIILLSATMSNSSQIGEWVEDLNGKDTKVIATTWRPVDLHIRELQSTWEIGDAAALVKNLTCPSDEVPELLLSDSSLDREVATNRMLGGIENTKTLLFVHTKSAGRKLEKQLKEEGYKAEFHNADLDKSKRTKLEKKFRGDLDILIATSTLAWGINLPARNTIVVGKTRGGSIVSPLDVAQMAGRAGRFGMYERGDVYLINCKMEQDFQVTSRLDQCLPFHLIAELYNGTFEEVEGAIDWFSRSLVANQHRKAPDRLIKEQLNNLIAWKCVEVKEDGRYVVTSLGKIARDLYLDPRDIYVWQSNFAEIERLDLWERSAELAWAMTSNIKQTSLEFTPQPLKQLVTEYKRKSLQRQSKGSNNEAMASILYFKTIKDHYDKYMISHIEAAIAPYFMLFQRDSGRIINALKRISTLNNWDRERDFDVIKARILYGVGEELMELVEIPGIGGTIATQLYKAGFRTLEDVLAKQDQLNDYIERKANVTRIKNGLKTLEQG